jgi:hypothetical protein
MSAHLRLEGEKIHLDRETLEAMATIEPLAEPVRAFLALQTADDCSAKLEEIAARLRGLLLPDGRWGHGVLEIADALYHGANNWDDSVIRKEDLLRSLGYVAEELGDWAEMLEDYGHTDHCDWLLGEQVLLRKILKGLE